MNKAGGGRRVRSVPRATVLRRFREAFGLKQEDLARLCGVCQQTYSRWESGAIVPEAPVQGVLARKLDTTVDIIWPPGSRMAKARLRRKRLPEALAS